MPVGSISISPSSEAARYRQLQAVVKHLEAQLADCRLCPRQCGVNRIRSAGGVCRTGRLARVCSYHAHFGEEDPLSGRNGSGTIFFSYCSLGCCFCQNYAVSHGGEGREVTSRELAQIMLALQGQGCHNINFVTPGHVVPQIVAALAIAVQDGLRIPLVYNSSGYDSLKTLQQLEGIFDIYMPDFKFWNSETARLTCQAPDYPDVARAALTEMHRQVGDLVLDESGLAQRGLLVRHLVMPHHLAGTAPIMQFIARHLSPATYINIMAQYHPCGPARHLPQLNRRISSQEYNEALQAARAAGLNRLDGYTAF